ncbi:MAG: DNA-binding protein [Flavobacteriaceae bacterium]|nr:DNA-binding protein [Flavobacteriaceae bacterium]|tara:strand:+ start:273 stop:734 length:462 start_codon:yes stop_codon:yes gene_type:complete
MEREEIFSKTMRAGRRTYFFDVRSTKAGDYYLTLTESKKFTNDDGSFHYKKHKIYLYKEDFSEFNSNLQEMTDYIIKEKGEEVISERHQKDYQKEDATTETVTEEPENDAEAKNDTEETSDENKESDKSESDDTASKDEDDSSEFTDVEFEDI